MLYNHLVERLAPLGLAYLHIIQGETGGSRAPEDVVQPFDYDALHQSFSGCWMVKNRFDRPDAEQALSIGTADLVAFGGPFISNPDQPPSGVQALRWRRRYTPNTRPRVRPGK